MFEIQYFSHQVCSPCLMLIHLVVFKIAHNAGVKLVNMQLVCHQEDVSQVLSSHCPHIIAGQGVELSQNMFGGFFHLLDEAQVVLQYLHLHVPCT